MEIELKRELELGNDINVNVKKPKIEVSSVTVSQYRTLDSMDTDILYNFLKENGISEEVADTIRNDNLKGTTIKMLNKDSLIQLGLKIGDVYRVSSFIEFRTLADSISETVGQFSSFSVPHKVLALVPYKPVDLRKSITELELLNDKLNNPMPKMYFTKSRRELADEISHAINTLEHSNGGNRIIAGIRGIGKSLFCRKIATVLSAYENFISIYHSYENNTTKPSDLLRAVCIHRGIQIPVSSNHTIGAILTFLVEKGFKPIIFADEIQVLYEKTANDKAIEVIKEYINIVESTSARVFFIGSSQSLITKAIDRKVSNGFPKLNSSRVVTTRILPLIDKDEFSEFVKGIISSPLTDEKLWSKFLMTGGIIRNIVESTISKSPSLDYNNQVSCVLQMIYDKNENSFDPFNQVTVSSQEIIKQLSDLSVTQEHINEWADKSYLLERQDQQYCFLYPDHYQQMKELNMQSLTFAERISLNFPIGYLAELYEYFLAEGLAETFPEMYKYDKTKNVLVINNKNKYQGKISNNQLFLWDLKKENFAKIDKYLFKMMPDIYGFDIMCVMETNKALEFEFYQVKMGHSNFSAADVEKCVEYAKEIEKLCSTIMKWFFPRRRSCSCRLYLMISRKLTEEQISKLQQAKYILRIGGKNEIPWPQRIKEYAQKEGIELP